jgi:hypothetical protein
VNRDEASAVASEQLKQLRTCSYAELRRRLLDRQESFVVVGPSGARYQVELQAVIDGPGENFRVMCSVDGAGLSAFAPLTGDFIVSSQDTFIGE